MESPKPVIDVPAALAEAQAAQERGDKDTATEFFRQVVAGSQDYWQLLLVAGDGLQACGHWTEAVAAFERALVLKPNSAVLLGRLEKAYFEFKDYGRAADYLRRYLEYDPRDIRLWAELGKLYTRARNFERVVPAYSHVLASEPLNVAAILGRGDAYVEMLRFDDALADYRRADTIEPNNPRILFRIGSLSLRFGAAKEAAALFHRLLHIDPQNVPAYANLSLALSAVGQYDDAAMVAQTAMTIDPESAHAGFAMGTAWLGLGRIEEAAEILKAASEAAPRNVDILAALADAESAREKPYAAELALQQILKVDPTDTAARFMIAAIHGEAVDAPPPDFAVKTFDQIAARYDHGIVPSLGYEAPTAAVALLEDTLPERSDFGKLLDLGCGTGLMAAAVRDAFRVDAATGIDVSSRMIEIATQKNLYDRLIVGDVVRMMGALKERFDLVTAIELAPYLGTLTPLMNAVSAALAPEGLLLCSIERGDEAPYKLLQSRRFAHETGYVKDSAAAAGLKLLAVREITLHTQPSAPTAGTLLLFQRG